MGAPFVTATTALAACAAFELPEVFPFEDQRVPVNAEMRVIAFGLESIELTFPDGVTQTTAIIDDAIGKRLDLQTPLAVGSYTFNRENLGSTASFVVDDFVDDVAPDAPTVSASRSTHLTPPDLLGIGDDCADAGFYDFITLTVDGVAAGDVVMVDGVVAAFASTAGSVTFTRGEGRGGNVAYDVGVRDLAGNESEPTRVEEWSGCPGGCSSTGALPLFGALLLLLLRHRARKRSRSQEVPA